MHVALSDTSRAACRPQSPCPSCPTCGSTPGNRRRCRGRSWVERGVDHLDDGVDPDVRRNRGGGHRRREDVRLRRESRDALDELHRRFRKGGGELVTRFTKPLAGLRAVRSWLDLYWASLLLWTLLRSPSGRGAGRSCVSVRRARCRFSPPLYAAAPPGSVTYDASARTMRAEEVVLRALFRRQFGVGRRGRGAVLATGILHRAVDSSRPRTFCGASSFRMRLLPAARPGPPRIIAHAVERRCPSASPARPPRTACEVSP
jgi:hypothetical protein